MRAVLVVLLIAAAQLQPAAPPRDAAPAKGDLVISGRVTERGSGRPLPRMIVTLIRTDRSTQLDAVSDEEGRYEFRSLEPGSYALSAGPDSHRSTYLHQRYGAEEPGLSDLDPPRPNLELTPGEARQELNIQVWRALGIEGRIIDPWETGMANVRVLVKRVRGRSQPDARVFSDDRGMYRAYGLAPGRYRVCAEIEEHSDETSDAFRLGHTCHPSSVVEASAAEIVLTSQDATGVDIRVQQFRSYSVSGFVADESGSPVDGAYVSAYPIDGDGPSASGTTRSGQFNLNGLGPGRYMVRAYEGESARRDATANDSAQVGYASADLTAVDASGIAVSLAKPVKVRGTVMFEGGRVPRGRGLRMLVQTRPVLERLSLVDGRPPFSAVGEDLSFELARVYRLPLIVRVTGLPDGWVLKSVMYQGRDVTYVPTDFTDDAGAGRLQLVITSHVAQPFVRVVDEQGATTTSCHIIAVPADPAYWRLALGWVAASPAPGGLMKLGPMLPGEYLIAALPRDDGLLLFSEPARLDALAAISTRVTVVKGDSRTFDLRLVRLPPKP